jgi:CheY-like chemotaxis protein
LSKRRTTTPALRKPGTAELAAAGALALGMLALAASGNSPVLALLDPHGQVLARLPLAVAAGGALLALAVALAWPRARAVPAAPMPLARSAANDAALAQHASAVSRAALRPAGVDRRRRSVLVAASDPGVRRSLLLAFASEERRVYAAADGAEALALAHQVRPDLALLEPRLARVPGYDVAKQLRHQYGRTVRLVAIGGLDPEDRARAFAAGFDEHLAKPFTQETLEALLEPYPPNRVRGLNRDASRSSS